MAEVFEGLCLVIAGALLLTPGFFTDGIGALLLVAAGSAARPAALFVGVLWGVAMAVPATYALLPAPLLRFDLSTGTATAASGAMRNPTLISSADRDTVFVIDSFFTQTSHIYSSATGIVTTDVGNPDPFGGASVPTPLIPVGAVSPDESLTARRRIEDPNDPLGRRFAWFPPSARHKLREIVLGRAGHTRSELPATAVQRKSRDEASHDAGEADPVGAADLGAAARGDPVEYAEVSRLIASRQPDLGIDLFSGPADGRIGNVVAEPVALGGGGVVASPFEVPEGPEDLLVVVLEQDDGVGGHGALLSGRGA